MENIPKKRPEGRSLGTSSRESVPITCCFLTDPNPVFPFVNIGVANGPLKTHGLAKFSPNFTDLAARLLAVMCVSQSRFFSQSCLAVSIFFKAKKVVKYQSAYFL